MKNLLLLIAVLFSTYCLAQEPIIDSCGLDNSKKLNTQEAIYFNQQFKVERKDFDFSAKNVGFTTGSSGKTIISKKEYFDNFGRTYFKEKGKIISQVLFLTPTEKLASGGIDAIVISWSKLKIEGKQRKKVLQLFTKLN